MPQQQSVEALAGTSTKRDRSKFMLEASDSPKSEQNDKLEEQTGPTRCELEKAKSSQTPCWRCLILKKKV
jgi:hypothetical protein